MNFDELMRNTRNSSMKEVEDYEESLSRYNCEDCKRLHEEKCSGTFETCDNFVDFRKESEKRVCKVCKNDVFFVKTVYREELNEDDYCSWIEEVLEHIELECYNCGEKVKI